MGTGESPLGPTQMCTLCVNLSRVWNGTELQLPRLCDGDNCGTQAQGCLDFGQNLVLSHTLTPMILWHTEVLGEWGVCGGGTFRLGGRERWGLPEAT